MEHEQGSFQNRLSPQHRRLYEERMQQLRATFDSHVQQPAAGVAVARSRAELVDELIQANWATVVAGARVPPASVSVVAVGGYGRSELFPWSDVDVMFLLESRSGEAAAKEPLRALNQLLWDAGLRVSPFTRTLAECGRFDAENVEFTLALLDARLVAGAAMPAGKLIESVIPKLIGRDRKRITGRLLETTRKRYAKYGDTLFHLEPNVKECPGGLRDVHVCSWLRRLEDPAAAPGEPVALGETAALGDPTEFSEARDFLMLVRAFLHFRHHRDDNTLDWQTQDEAAAAPLGIAHTALDASYWMRLYFRHARAVVRRVTQMTDAVSPMRASAQTRAASFLGRRGAGSEAGSFEIVQGRLAFTAQGAERGRPEYDPDVVLAIFAAIAREGATLARETETRLEGALPRLSQTLEDGPALWNHLRAILTGAYAGRALRVMHALGILELVIPEFHGIDALVIRDAYHRYTVDEHTFVLIDTLHALTLAPARRAGEPVEGNPWASRFAGLLRDLQHPELLYLAALLHDTGKGHASSGHAQESARLARSVLERLELDEYESGMVVELIRNHLEMSAALRRDVFDAETIRSFAARVPTPEALRMLTLFTYADIAAVHPDALTPWKAENLWRLHLATANFLDRNVDDERVPSASESELGDVLYRVHAMLRDRRVELARFLEGLPLRYLQTRTPDHIRTHFEMAARLPLAEQPLPAEGQIDFRYHADLSEVTLVTRDRPMLFASMAGALSAWGMNIVTADAFSNAHGVVVDSFRFIDTFHTLRLNESERMRFVESLNEVIGGQGDLEKLMAGRRRARRRSPKMCIETRIDFDDSASTQSTLLQVVAQDTPGLLRALALTIATHACNIEVALIDTEGEMAIDVFYITRNGAKLDASVRHSLDQALQRAVADNAQ